MSDRIAVMRAGRIEQLGRPTEIYERPATRFVAGFIGSINMLPARVTGARDAQGMAALDCGAGPAQARVPDGAGATATLTIRPERLRLGEAPPGAIAWPATIERIIYLGARIEMRLRWRDGSAALAEMPNDGRGAWAEGAAVTTWFMPSDAWVIAES